MNSAKTYDEFLYKYKSQSRIFIVLMVMASICLFCTGVYIIHNINKDQNSILVLVLKFIGMCSILIALFNIIYGIEFIHYLKLTSANIAFNKFKKKYLEFEDFMHYKKVHGEIYALGVSLKAIGILFCIVYILSAVKTNHIIDNITSYPEFIPLVGFVFSVIVYPLVKYYIKKYDSMCKLINSWYYNIYVVELLEYHGLGDDIISKLSDESAVIVITKIQEICEINKNGQ